MDETKGFGQYVSDICEAQISFTKQLDHGTVSSAEEARQILEDRKKALDEAFQTVLSSLASQE